MNIYELAEKIGGEIVGGRLLGMVDGKKQYLSDVGSDGQPFLNAEGIALANEPMPATPITVEETATVAEEAPKRKKKNESGVEVDDVQIEI
jgi:hypothetical protein